MITKLQLSKILDTNKDFEKWLDPLNKNLVDVKTKGCAAMFLSQCSHESNQFKVLVENLNYSADGLMKIFSKYFKTIESTLAYARKPEKIANKVYANRMSNGDEASGDGWKYRGKSIIQCTGKANHQEFAEYKKITIEAVCDYLLTVEGSVEYGLFFWKTRGLIGKCTAKDIPQVTKIINGGLNGLDHRTSEYHRILQILQT